MRLWEVLAVRRSGLGRAQLPAAMGPSSIVAPGALGQDRPQMPFAEDQHPVGDFGARTASTNRPA